MFLFRKVGPLFGRFLVVGLSGTLVNLAVLWLLVRLGLPAFGAALIATEVSIVNNFVWNDYWTFKRQGQLPIAVRFGRFQIISGLSAIFTLSLFAYFTNVLHLYYLFAQAISIGLATLLNFAVNAKLTWRLESFLVTAEVAFSTIKLESEAEENVGG